MEKEKTKDFTKTEKQSKKNSKANKKNKKFNNKSENKSQKKQHKQQSPFNKNKKQGGGKMPKENNVDFTKIISGKLPPGRKLSADHNGT